MKLTYIALTTAITLALTACSNGQNTDQTYNQPATSQTAANTAQSAAPVMPTPAMTGSSAQATSSMNGAAAASTSASHEYGSADSNWFGGPIYHGEPNLHATAALVKAGGGADDFSFQKALVSMLGEDTVKAEVAKLNKQYGETAVNNFVNGMTFDVKDALKRATEQGISLPEAPADLHGKKLASALVEAGTAPDGTFWSGYLFDKALSHALHDEVMADVDANSSHEDDKNTHKILNQAMYDVAQALGHKDVKLAPLH